MSKILRQYKLNGSTLVPIDYTWEYIYDNLEKMKKEFRDKNHTDVIQKNGRVDRAYQEYCDCLQEFLDSTPIDEIDKSYRIKEAKRRREMGISPWIKPET